MSEVLGAFLIFTLIPLLGTLPLTAWIVRLFTGKNLRTLGTKNASVSAAFYHGGTPVGLIAVVAEGIKGISAVLLARHFFPAEPAWQVLSLIFLILGRYWGSQGAGTTNIAWGFFAYDPVVAAFTLGISLVSFTILRQRQQGKYLVLVLMPLLTALTHPTEGMRILAVATLSATFAWIYHKIPDDLDLPSTDSQSARMFQFFQGDRALPNLAQKLTAPKVGPKAATLSQLNAWGYPVPPGYILPAGDDPKALIETVFPIDAQAGTSLNPNPKANPYPAVVVRSSATGEDTPTASAAGQYTSVTDVTSADALEAAIIACLKAYNAPSAIRYRQDRGIAEGSMNVLVQPQIKGVYSGVAFSRDPVSQSGDAVVVEALPGPASQVVSGQITPERYHVTIRELAEGTWDQSAHPNFPIEGAGQIPKHIIQQVAHLTRHIENSFHGIPQDVEWTYDGQQLWVLQSRPITTLMPIWTRKIAAEVIPGVVRPLTWSINRPLTCGVWGDIFKVVLAERATDLDFSQTATLHFSHAYFNATLLGEIFTRMGLPPESLEFLTRGAKFRKPPLLATLKNVPGLLRLLRQERRLPRQFAQAKKAVFAPAFDRWRSHPVTELDNPAIAQRIHEILDLLEQATYFNILAPLGLALRQAILNVDLTKLDSSQNPETQALKELQAIAADLRPHFSTLDLAQQRADRFLALSGHPNAHLMFAALDRFLDQYGYLSEVATDIAVPTWDESPQPVRNLLAQYLSAPPAEKTSSKRPRPAFEYGWRTRQVQARLNLKGQVAEVYNRLMATLRHSFVAIENRWLVEGLLERQGDVFFLTWDAIQRQIAEPTSAEDLQLKISLAKAEWQQHGGHIETGQSVDLNRETEDRKRDRETEDRKIGDLEIGDGTAVAHEIATAVEESEFEVPYLAYGNAPSKLPTRAIAQLPAASGTLRGIGASAGQREGTIRIVKSLTDSDRDIDSHTILVVPYTDAGWSPMLARIGGLISEVGGQLSHGAIVAREYGIPAIMDVANATSRLANGQRVRIDGQTGTIEILSS